MKNITWSWDEPDEDIKPEEPDYPESLAEIYEQEQGMRALEEAMWKKYQAEEALVPSEEERLSLLEPTPYDAGVCQGCGEHIAAGMLHEHQCVSEDEDDCDHTCNCVCPLCLG